MPELALTALRPMQEDRKKKSSVPAAPSPCSLAPTRTPAIPAEVQRPASWSSVTAAISKRRLSDTKAVVLVPQWEDQQSFTLLLARPAVTTGCLLAVTARTQLLHHTRAQRRRKHTAAQDRASPLELATAAASQQKAEDAFGYTQGPFTSYKSEKTQLKPLTSLPHDIDKGSNTLSPALLFRLGKHLYQTRYRLFNDKIGILQSFS